MTLWDVFTALASAFFVSSIYSALNNNLIGILGFLVMALVLWVAQIFFKKQLRTHRKIKSRKVMRK